MRTLAMSGKLCRCHVNAIVYGENQFLERQARVVGDAYIQSNLCATHGVISTMSLWMRLEQARRKVTRTHGFGALAQKPENKLGCRSVHPAGARQRSAGAVVLLDGRGSSSPYLNKSLDLTFSRGLIKLQSVRFNKT
jgi:hypothetical protein